MRRQVTFEFVRFEWTLADLWVGVFWRRERYSLDVWVCLLPCIPLHLQWTWKPSLDGL